MTEKEKEIQSIYQKYADKGLIECKNMTAQEQKKYSKEQEPKMIEEIKKVIEKYEKKNSTTL